MLFHKDPCGIFCMLLMYASVVYADYVVTCHIIYVTLTESLWGSFHVVFFNFVVVMLLFAHSRVVFSDPGTVPLPKTALDFSEMRQNKGRKDQQCGDDDWTVCQRCETYRPPKAHHCRVCRRCIRRMGHHCLWVNNCIGELNQKYFIQFLVYSVVLCVYTLILNISNFVWMFGHKTTNADIFSRMAPVLHGIALCLESVVFCLVVVVVLHEQISSILGDNAAAEQTIYKNRKERLPKRRKQRMALLREVFGYGPVYCWLLPCSSVTNTTRSALPGSYNV